MPRNDCPSPYRIRYESWPVVCLTASGLLCAAVSFVYWYQPDLLAGLTLFPAWSWGIPGLALWVLGFTRGHWTRWLAIGGSWLVFLTLAADTPQSILRIPRTTVSGQLPSRHLGRTIRVMSFNTGGAALGAIEQIKQNAPDILLLQESFSQEHVAQVARELFGDAGGFCYSGDTSIVARGRLRRLVPDPANWWDRQWLHRGIVAEVELLPEQRLLVASLRLSPQPVRLDFWHLDWWSGYEKLRQTHRRELAQLIAALGTLPDETPAIVGGDFNAPASDAIFTEFGPTWKEAFRTSGRGWGNTFLNEYPLLRIDQVWIHGPLQSVQTWALQSRGSDHRFVLTDLVWSKAPVAP